MSQRSRKILLSLAIIFFILFTPVILFYAWGYSFDWQEKKPVLTGALYLRSVPKEAEIFINGKKKGETPAFLKHLLPKEYQVEVIKEGFHPWQKKLKIKSKLVTEVKNILLIPSCIDFEIIRENLEKDFYLADFLNQNKYSANFFLQKPSYILYKKNADDLSQQQINLTPLPESENYQIIISPQEKIAVLDEKGNLYLFNPENKIFELISGKVKQAVFSDEGKLLYFTSSEIWIYHSENNFCQLATRLSQEIQQAIFYNEHHVVFSTKESIQIIEINQEQGNITELFKFGTDQIIYTSKEKCFYLVRKEKLLKFSLNTK